MRDTETIVIICIDILIKINIIKLNKKFKKTKKMKKGP